MRFKSLVWSVSALRWVVIRSERRFYSAMQRLLPSTSIGGVGVIDLAFPYDGFEPFTEKVREALQVLEVIGGNWFSDATRHIDYVIRSREEEGWQSPTSRAVWLYHEGGIVDDSIEIAAEVVMHAAYFEAFDPDAGLSQEQAWEAAHRRVDSFRTLLAGLETLGGGDIH